MTDSPRFHSFLYLASCGVLRRRATGASAFSLALLMSVAAGLFVSPTGVVAQAARSTPRSADYIVAVVNQELVTNAELEQRITRIRDEAARNKTQLPPGNELRKQVLDALIDERVQVTNARESGQRLDDSELDRAVANVAVQNQMTLPQLRERLRAQGLDYAAFRNNVRDQMMMERVREREVMKIIRISEADVDALLDKRRAEAGSSAEYNIAQILVTVPDGASVSETTERLAKAQAALARVKGGGEAFETVARDVSEDGNKAKGGVIGMRPADRLPDVFVDVVKTMKPGEISPTLLRTGAGFHVLQLLEKREPSAFTYQQTRARHILLRVSPQLTQEAASSRLAGFKRQIEGGKSFEQIARDNSEDGSAPQGGELGWTSPGQLVPEFEEAMNALALNGISDPVITRFGVHLIQVEERRQATLDTKQQREQARNILREQKFDDAYAEWIRDLRARAYIEMREPPL